MADTKDEKAKNEKEESKKDAPLADAPKGKKAADLDAAAQDDEHENEYEADKKKELENASPDDLVSVYVSSKDAPVEHKDGRHFVTGSVNGETFEVPVDEQVRIKRKFAEVLQPLIQKQRNGGHPQSVNTLDSIYH